MARARVRLGVVVAAVAALFIVAGPAGAADKGVTIAGFAFNPGTITVRVGDTVTWTNNDGTTHTATSSGFDTGRIAGGSSASVTFHTAGTFAYHCAIHPSMTGTVVVEAAASGGGGGGGSQPTTPPTDTVGRVPSARGDDTRDIGGPGAIAFVLAGVLGTLVFTRRRAAG